MYLIYCNTYILGFFSKKPTYLIFRMHTRIDKAKIVFHYYRETKVMPIRVCEIIKYKEVSKLKFTNNL